MPRGHGLQGQLTLVYVKLEGSIAIRTGPSMTAPFFQTPSYLRTFAAYEGAHCWSSAMTKLA
jgi:hypothetical protein